MRHARTLRPEHHLLDPRGAVGVGRDDERLATLRTKSMGKLAGGRRLARTVHAVEQDAGGVTGEVQLARLLRHHGGGDRDQCLGGLLARARGTRTDACREASRHCGAEVGRDQHLLELVVVARRKRCGERAEACRQDAARAAADSTPEARLRFAQPAWAVVAARLAGLRMSSSRTETRCDEPLSSR